MSVANPNRGRTGLERIGYGPAQSAEGLEAALVRESAFRKEMPLAPVLTPPWHLLR